ncbi:MAG: SpoIIE family protein phosphatase [Salinivirgaceae bacterium]|nr:SpoIIE family protein phosphatase [Salinivirgaceae bacterium]
MNSYIYKVRLIFAFIFLFLGVSGKTFENVKVQNGILDLRGGILQDNREIKLNGEWEFYWNKLLFSADFSSINPDSVKYISVPALWSTFKYKGKELPANGAATYRMQVLLDSLPGEMALKMGSVGTAFKLIIDGVEIYKAGNVSLVENEAIPAYNPGVAFFSPKNDTIEVLIHVSNYHYCKAGLWSNVYSLGAAATITQAWNREIQLSLFLIGSIVIFAFYHLGLYILNKNFRYTIYFFLFCINVVVRILVVDEIFLLQVFPNFDWNILVKIEYSTLMVGTMIFCTFIYKFFTEEFPKSILIVILTVNSLLTLFVFSFPPAVFTRYLIVYQLSLLLPSLYLVGVVIKAMKMKRQSALTLLVGFVIFVFTLINDILYANRLIFTMYLTSFGFMAFVFSQAYMLSVRFSSLLTNTEKLAFSLEKTNKNLEQLVDKRTSKIKEQNVLLKNQRNKILSKSKELEEQNDAIKIQRNNLQLKNELALKQKMEITSSIEYASSIQGAVLFSDNDISSLGKEGFVLFKAKDIVSADFYWFKEIKVANKKLKIAAVVDCTGQGVSGALMSIMGALFLDKAVKKLNANNQAANILENISTEIKNFLNKQSKDLFLKDGMDVACAIYDEELQIIQFAGAQCPMFVIRNKNGKYSSKIEEFYGDSISIGGSPITGQNFTNYSVNVHKGDLVYLFTDGYYSQIGGELGDELALSSFKKLLLKYAHLSLSEQKTKLEKSYLEWRKNHNQVDNITIVGFKI